MKLVGINRRNIEVRKIKKKVIGKKRSGKVGPTVHTPLNVSDCLDTRCAGG